MTFTEYCAKEGVELLKGDLVFIQKQLKHIPKPHQKAVVQRYVKIWVKVRDECENPVQAQNRARRAANLSLLNVKTILDSE